MVNSGKALDTLTREELGIDPKELGGSAWVAAVSSVSVFTLGAIVPVTPLFFASGNMAVTLSAVSSAIALFGLGAATTVFTGRNALFAGTRQMLIGLAAAAITYGLGRLLGVAIGG
jgi:vacuolar iron transporter family protein